MYGGSPPSSRRGPLAERLQAARGLIRNGTGAIRNLEQLLRSRNVGPRALGELLPDVRAACAPLVFAFREALGAIGERLPAAASALEALVIPELLALEPELQVSTRKPLQAKQRLELERRVAQVADTLETSTGLLDLLREAAESAPSAVDVREVLQGAVHLASEARQIPSVHTSTTVDGSVEVLLDRRVAFPLIAIGLDAVARQAPGAEQRLHVSPLEAGGAALTIQPGQPTAPEARPVAPAHFAVTLTCAREAAAASGSRFDWDEDRGAVALQWSRAENSQPPSANG